MQAHINPQTGETTITMPSESAAQLIGELGTSSANADYPQTKALVAALEVAEAEVG